MVMVVTMVVHGSEYRSCNDHEEKRGNKNPLHATNLA